MRTYHMLYDSGCHAANIFGFTEDFAVSTTLGRRR
jgi:hypothetical protein